MTYYIREGSTFHVTDDKSIDIRDILPGRNYTLMENQNNNLYLKDAKDFTLPDRLYGDVHQRTARIINTFTEREASTGVLLAGLKGSGKSLLAKNICTELKLAQGVPTIIINHPFVGTNFNTFVQKIDQPCVILFDEFEKVYSKELQPYILSLLDGVYPSKKLFILTVNDKYKVDVNMKNRPGRLYYSLTYQGLTNDEVVQYCEDNLNNQKEIGKILRLKNVFDDFNFDMLKALVEEMNRYEEDAQTAIELLNIQPQSNFEHYEVTVLKDGEVVHKIADHRCDLYRNNSLYFSYKTGEVDEDGDEEFEWVDIMFGEKNIQEYDPVKGTATCETKGYTIKLNRVELKYDRWRGAF